MQTIPSLSADLIVELRKTFPVVTAAELHAMTADQMHYYAGQQSLVEFLELRLAQTIQDALS